MIISSERLTKVDFGLDNCFISDYILKAMRVQRKENIMCDAIVKCSEKEFPVHKSMMYAHSHCCRRLFTGSFSPMKRDSIIIIDLSDFSANVVSVFLDTIYGDKGEESVDIEVEELIKLFDFLQADNEAEILSEILRRVLDVSNCVELYKLAGAYNFNKLQTVIVTFICRTLTTVIKSDSWKNVNQQTLFSLLKHPSIQCKPTILVGEVLQSHFSENTSSNILMGVKMEAQSLSPIEMCFPEKDNNIVLKRGLLTSGTIILYFVFRKELFCLREFVDGQLGLCRYNQSVKRFELVLPHICTLRRFTRVHVLVDEGDKGFVNILCIPTEMDVDVDDGGTVQFSLVKLTVVNEIFSNEGMLYIDINFNCTENSTVYNSKSKRIFFFDRSYVHIYSIDSKSFVESQEVHNPIDYESKCYIEFKGHIYLITHEDETITLYIFNETTYCWDLILEHKLRLNVAHFGACSSSTEFAIQLQTLTEDGHLDMDYVYLVDFESKSLKYTSSSIHVMDQYLFVPDYISL